MAIYKRFKTTVKVNNVTFSYHHTEFNRVHRYINEIEVSAEVFDDVIRLAQLALSPDADAASGFWLDVEAVKP